MCLKIVMWHYTSSLIVENWDKTLLDVSFVWKLSCDTIRFLSCFEIEMRHYSMFYSFEKWNVTLYESFFVLRLKCDIIRFLSRLKIEIRHYIVFLFFDCTNFCIDRFKNDWLRLRVVVVFAILQIFFEKYWWLLRYMRLYIFQFRD